MTIFDMDEENISGSMMVPGTEKKVSRWKAAGVHLVCSAAVLAVIAFGIFHVWYPFPYASLSGGLKLFGLLALVDVFLGPLATLIVSNPKKSLIEWRRDVGIIILLQLIALGYGLWTVAQARPVFLVYEIDRFRIVHAVDVPSELMESAPLPFRTLPMSGPKLIAVRPFHDQTERAEVTLAALQGLDIGARPDFWMDYEQAVPQVLSVAKPVSMLLAESDDQERALVEEVLKTSGKSVQDVNYLPLVGRGNFWTVLLDGKTLIPFGYVPVDSFE